MPQENNFVKIILLKNFANYFDRKIFYYRTLKEYNDNKTTSGVYESKEFENINFNPNDGVDTSLVLKGYETPLIDLDLSEFNYLLVCENQSSESALVLSRWYIMDAVRNSKGIYTLSLRRDVVSEVLGSKGENWSAPFYIERSMALPDPQPRPEEYNFIFLSDEGMNLSQIKQSETLIKDRIGSGWIVGYYSKLSESKTINVPLSTSSVPFKTFADLESETGIPQSILESMITVPQPAVVSDLIISYGVAYGWIGGKHYQFFNYISQDFLDYQPDWQGEAAWSHKVGLISLTGSDWHEMDFAEASLDVFYHASTNDKISSFTNVISHTVPGEKYISLAMINKLRNIAEKGTIVKYNDAYYTLKINGGTKIPHAEVTVTPGLDSLFDDIPDALAAKALELGGSFEEYDDWRIYLNYEIINYSIELQTASAPGSSQTLTLTFPTSANTLSDGSYNMFAMPLDPAIWDAGGPVVNTTEREISLRIASYIATELSSNLIDLQILPYAPNIVRANVEDGGPKDWLNFDYLTENIDYIKVKDGNNTTKTFIYFEKQSTFSFIIDKNLDPEFDDKIESNATLYRLCSPNYCGAFDFNLAKTGRVSFFEIDCTYKPFNPFIKVAPQFSRIYGQNFKDARGLICSGDFSLPVITDQWKTYENNNKAYGQIFARDIQNLEFKQKQEQFREPFSIISGVSVGTGAGALAGAKAGPYGAIAGAAIGASAGIAGGLIDLSLNQARRAEEKDYAYDKFNLSLANIKAMPQTLSKNSVLTAINKIFPYIEYYKCSDAELLALQNRIKYYGMTTNLIGTIYSHVSQYGANFLGRRESFNYFKGQLIRADDVKEDNHFISILYDEFEKGVYI